MATALGVASLLVGVAGTVTAQKQADKAADEAKKAKQVDQAMAARADAKSKREQVRKARIQRAQVIQQGASGGVMNSSGVQGGAASIDSQANSNINTISDNQFLSRQRNEHLSKSVDYSASANQTQAFTNMAQSTLGTVKTYGDKNWWAKGTGALTDNVTGNS